MSPSEMDEMNQAIVNAESSFNLNPTYSKANEIFYSAMSSFPTSVSISLQCFGYSGIDLKSLPTWLSAVPTSYVSDVLYERSVYQSIVNSYEGGSASQSSTPVSSTVVDSTITSAPQTSSASGTADSATAASSTSKPSSTSSSTGQSSPSPSSGGASQLSKLSMSGVMILGCSIFALLL